ncbi:unnamed protein product [Effrenium voratum]|nr:unnamed protein product [Effrenium voratum]
MRQVQAKAELCGAMRCNAEHCGAFVQNRCCECIRVLPHAATLDRSSWIRSSGPIFCRAAAMETKGQANGGSVEPLASPNLRGRSMSPVQTTTAGQSRSASGAMTHRGPLTAWGEAMASPRTPRQHQAELRLGMVLAELQRQSAEDRRTVQRQLEHFDRRLQEHLAAPAASRERWADLQGSVSGLLEEVASLVRRVEGLDEKLRIRTASCEESLRQRARELEQQLHGQQQKVQLAVSTFEEMSKRQTAKLRKVAQTGEEQARRIAALEDMRRPQDLGRLEARLSELEGQQASLEEEFRNVAASSAVAQAIPRPESDAAHALETELATLSKHLAAQLDEHSAALANLRVRTDSQEQRLLAAGERLEKVVGPSLEALRTEMQQFRSADRADMDQRFEHFARQLKDMAESNDETMGELRDQIGLPVRDAAEGAELQRIRDTCTMQDQQLRRLEATLESQRDEEICGVLVRLEGLENRLDGLGDDNMSEKADRAELHRLDLAVQELQQPLRRLSQRTASNEARTSGLEHKLEQLQDKMNPNSAVEKGAEGFVTQAGLEAISQQLAELSARMVEVEAESQPQTIGQAKLEEVTRRLESLEITSSRQAGPVPSAALPEEVLARLDSLAEGVSSALKTAESSGSSLQALRFDFVVEQERAEKLHNDLQGLARQRPELHSQVQLLSAKLEEQDTRTSESLQKMAGGISQVQSHHGALEDSSQNLAKIMEGMIARVEAAEAQAREDSKTRDLGSLEARVAKAEALNDKVEDLARQVDSAETEVQLKSLRADLSEAQNCRDKEMERLLAKATDAAVHSVQEIVSSQTKNREPQDPDLARRVDEVLSMAKATDERISNLRDELSPKWEDLERLERQLADKARAELQADASTSKKVSEELEELRGTVEDALHRLEASEAASKAVREELMEESPDCGLARTCQSDLQGVHSDVADLQSSLRHLASRFEDSKRSPMGDGRRLELRVHELQKQVAEELEQLTQQQKLIRDAQAAPDAGRGLKMDTQELERSVERLAAQVSQELQELRAHQGELGKVRTQLSQGKGPEVESKILDLQQKVVAELDALAKQQAELGKAKATMADLSDRVRQAVTAADECKKATNGLEERLKKLSSIEETACPKCGNVHLADAIFCRECGHKRGDPVKAGAKVAAGAKVSKVLTAGDSDVDDSYGADDFEESADDASASEDRLGGSK